MKNETTIDPREVRNFSAHARAWWDERGAFRVLHRMNPLRLQFLQDQLRADGVASLKGLTILDVGCGGGLLCEPLARLGAHVTGIDATVENIETAQKHSQSMNLPIDYQWTTAEDLAAQGLKFDVVVSFEVIEHVAHAGAFIQALTSLVKPGGHLFLSTLNRTPQSYLFGILAAEYVLGWAPKGTHNWQKFLSPQELAQLLKAHEFENRAVQGLNFSPFTQSWSLGSDVSMNYLMYAQPQNREK